MAAESAKMKNAVLGVLTLLDGTGTPVTLTLAYDDGDLNASNLSEVLNECTPVERRGKIISLVFGKRRYPELSFSVFVGNLVGSSNSAPGTPLEFVTKKGAYSGNTGTMGNGPYTCDVRLTIEGTNLGDAADETITFEDCRFTGAFQESMEGDKISFTATCYGSVVHANSTNTATLAQAA